MGRHTRRCVWALLLISVLALEGAAAETSRGREDRGFDAAAFREPPSFLWPGYFWCLNDRIDESRLIAQLRDMRAQDARSVCVLPMPPEFRPDTMGTRLDRPFLSEAYFTMIRAIAVECERLGMHYWLYDEGGWPSGGACGQVYARNPEGFACKALVCEEARPDPDGRYTIPRDAVCAAVPTGGDAWRVHPAGSRIDALPPDAKVRVFRVQRSMMASKPGARHSPYADLLCPEAMRTFRTLVHDGHRKCLGDMFGKTIRFTFTDEPAVLSTRPPLRLTWTDDLADEFQRRKGYDLLGWLPELLSPIAAEEDPALTRARVDFYDVWSALFVERYLVPIRQWCAAAGLESGGHFGGEDEPGGNADHGFGHILRAMRGLDMPGSDTIWRQIFPGVRSHPFAKYASSIARQKGQPYVFTESFAVYGSGLTPAQMKWVTDHQYVRGASLTVVSNYPYSTREHLMPGCRPQFGRSNPLWRYLDLYHGYTARLGYLLTRGEPVCSTAVYHDVRSIWAGGDARARAIRLHEGLAETLLRGQREFDFIDDDVLAGREGRVADEHLVVGSMHYDTLLVPATDWMEPAALRGLAEFARGGGTVIAVEGIPSTDGGRESLLEAAGADVKTGDSEIRVGRGRIVVAPLQEAVAMLRPLIRLEPPREEIRVCKRLAGETALYLLVNQAADQLPVTAHFPEQQTAVVCDLDHGRRYPLGTRRQSHGTAADLVLEPWGSIAILFGGEADAPPRPRGGTEILALAKGWSIRPLRAYRVGQDDYEVHEMPQAAAQPVELGDWQASLGPTFSGDAEYAVRFQWDAGQPARGTRLRLGKVDCACEVILNGQPVGRRIWPPFELDIGETLRPGTNELRVVVTNTLANALLDPEVRRRWAEMKTGLVYDGRAAAFEQDSLGGGLSGPVCIVAPAAP